MPNRSIKFCDFNQNYERTSTRIKTKLKYFQPLMPHDLLHFLVEQELNLENAIFGQIADVGW